MYDRQIKGVRKYARVSLRLSSIMMQVHNIQQYEYFSILCMRAILCV